MIIAKEFLEKLLYYQNNSHIDDTIDYIFNTLDDLLYEGNAEEVDTILKEIDIPLFSTEILVSIIAITDRYKFFLKRRASFFMKVKKYFIENSINVDTNLNGFE